MKQNTVEQSLGKKSNVRTDGIKVMIHSGYVLEVNVCIFLYHVNHNLLSTLLSSFCPG